MRVDTGGLRVYGRDMTETTIRFAKGQTIDMGGTAVTMHDAGTLHTFTSAAGTTYAPVLDSLPAMLKTGMIRTAKSAH